MAFLCLSDTPLLAQSSAKPLGTVSSSDASVTGGSAPAQLVSDRASIGSNTTVTANAGRNADVALSRGGSVLVCQTTAVHMTAAAGDALLLALDRGAMEIKIKASAGDVVMTPDLRFTLASAGPLDLRLRVTFNGDTCVENRGRKAPQLNISDAFGEASYLIKPGQHVMFEHGSLRAVMDHETTPCGCPPEEKRASGSSLAEALLRGGQGATITPQQAAAEHPFPTAVSDGLASPAPVPQTSSERHVEVSSTLRFDPSAGAAVPAPAPPAAVAAISQAAAEPAGSRNPLTAIGHFFKRIFVR